VNQLLTVGETLTDAASGQPLRIDEYLGAGSQGEVYRVSLAESDFALKWYFPQAATESQKTAINELIGKGSPSASFLWPLAMVQSNGVRGFGYVMGLRPSGYRSLRSLVKRAVQVGFDSRMTVGYELAHNFLLLHARGLCYRDISLGNVFFRPSDGSVLICDTDNVGIDGESESGVLGTPKFMAPEVVRGEERPSASTDLYSLAVLLFYLTMVAHPLDGAREASIHSMDEPARRRLYGTAPIFIFDPQDASNRPVPGIHDNALAHWPIYPEFLRDLFTRAFTEGVREPSRRVRESEWRLALSRARDLVVACPSCRAQSFYDLESGTDGAKTCWNCKASLPTRMWLDSGQAQLVIEPRVRVYPHHVDLHSRWDFSSPLAEVVPHPGNADRLGLKNLTGRPLHVLQPEGSSVDLPQQRAVDLTPGTRIDFGTGALVVRAAKSADEATF